LPDYNIGIELNGIYWHSELCRPNDYHTNKLDLCLSKNIPLIQIWEDEFYSKPEIIKSMLLSVLNKLPNEINVNDCTIKEINLIDYQTFLNNNYLGEPIDSSIRLGLFNNQQLISIIGLNELKPQEFKLECFVNLLDTNIINGLNVLLSYFEKTFEPKSIITFIKADFPIYSDLFINNGFILINKTAPNYYEILNDQRIYLTEQGDYRIYDSGNFTYLKTIKNEKIL